MRPVAIAVAVLVSLASALDAADALSEARRLYNLGQYENAERLARDAVRIPASANAARVVLGRIQLERYRRSAASEDLVEARASFRAVDPRALDPRERVELIVGLGQALYLEDLFGAAAELFGLVLDSALVLGPAGHERVLDWWATASDRHAQSTRSSERPAAAPPTERQAEYARLLERMTAEMARAPGSTPAVYWVAAAARGAGNLDRAWSAALAGWTLGPLMRDRGAALRADLDRLVAQGIIPDRAARLPQRDRAAAIAGMAAEWEAFKDRWN